MKKLLGIVVLGLLLNGNAFSKTISSYEDLDLTSKPKKAIIITKNFTGILDWSVTAD